MTIATSKLASVTIIALSQVMAMTLWFSASAVIPALVAEYGLTGFAQAALTSGVQAGFVLGCLVSAYFGLPDRVDPRRLFAMCTLIGAGANGLLLIVNPASPVAPLLRVLTGIAMAGVYPVGMKLASTWARGDMGLMVGILVGALTLGSALPHLFNVFGGLEWRITVVLSTWTAFVAALLIRFAGIGPNRAPMPPFDPHAALSAWRDVPLRLANLGYLGHMWELYAMWAWIGVFLTASFALTLPDDVAPAAAKLTAFATIAAGGIGSVAAGLLADRLGRTTITIAAMAISGTCAATIGFLYGGNPGWLVAVCLIWGISIVADSAQFSASIAELADRARVGTMLTVQTALGFTLTLITIHLMPPFVTAIGWRFAFLPLAVGPVVGVIAMARLRAHPASVRLAGGRREGGGHAILRSGELSAPGVPSFPVRIAQRDASSHRSRTEDSMAYHLEGRLLEVCNCRVLCPCWIGEDPDFGTCDTIVAWHFDNGKINGVDVSDRTIAVIAHVPGNILEGNWRAAVYLDDRVTPEQEEAILAVYTGKLGGPVGDLVKLIAEVVSVEKVPITFDVQGGLGTIKLGDAGYAELEPYKSATGQTTTLTDTVFSTVPGAPVFVGKSPRYRSKNAKLGIDLDIKGHNALQSTFVFNA